MEVTEINGSQLYMAEIKALEEFISQNKKQAKLEMQKHQQKFICKIDGLLVERTEEIVVKTEIKVDKSNDEINYESIKQYLKLRVDHDLELNKVLNLIRQKLDDGSNLFDSDREVQNKIDDLIRQWDKLQNFLKEI